MAARSRSAAAASSVPTWLEAAGVAVARRFAHEWRATPVYDAWLSRPLARGPGSARPQDFRPPDFELGAAVAQGRFPLAGAVLDAGPQGDPWDRPSPTRALAVQLHRFAWLPSLLAHGVDGGAEGLRLVLAWRDLFERPNPFAWGPEVLERRVYNLACGLSALAAPASEREAEALAQSLARQARRLLGDEGGPARRAERLAAAAVAGCALAPPAGERLLRAALPRLARALESAVLPDGGLLSRSPEQGMELSLDLATLDDALLQLGRETPEPVARARDRLRGAVRFFTLPDGRLAAFNGGGPSDPARVDAEGEADLRDAGRASPYAEAPHTGYHRLEGGALVLVVDAGPPPPGAWSEAACAQPLAFELDAAGERLFVNSGWTPDAAAPAGLRLAAAGTTVSLGGLSPGRPLTGFAARALGPRLEGGAARVEARRETGEAGVWLELSHDGWAGRFGLLHHRRLFLDPAHDELRGEDRLAPADPANPPVRGAPAMFARFHLHEGVDASLARDGRSVLLRGRARAWWFRNDAGEVRLEPSVRVEGGVARRTSQVVLTAPVSADGARLRWKLSPVEPPSRPTPPSAAAAVTPAGSAQGSR